VISEKAEMLKTEKPKSALEGRALSQLKAKALVIIVSVSFAFVNAQAQHEDHAGPAATNNTTFNSIKALAGDWEGTFEWLGTVRKGPMDVRYYLTGNGSAVVEDLISDGKPTMTTVYHLNGTELRATHYCGAGNQPRLKAAPTNEKDNWVRFEMIDITNLAKPEAGHVKALELRFGAPNELTILFTFVSASKETVEEIKLKRKT
jgi:hypothetical protein